jgi:hypothetical protein
MKVLRFACFAAALPALFLASCSPDGWGLPRAMEAHEIRAFFPSVPASWTFLPGLKMSLSWRDPEGRLRSAEAEPGSSLCIEVERGFPQALIASPSSSGKPLFPAGALYPEALVARKGGEERDQLRLDWRGGYAASVAAALEKGGVDPSGYDLYALVDEAVSRAEDPWLVSPLATARRLAESDFRIDSYRKPKRFSLGLPGMGPWAPESPFAPGPEASSVRLPEGLWRFVGIDEELFVSVDKKGKAICALR